MLLAFILPAYCTNFVNKAATFFDSELWQLHLLRSAVDRMPCKPSLYHKVLTLYCVVSDIWSVRACRALELSHMRMKQATMLS